MPEAEWIENLGVRHRAKSESAGFHVSDLYRDFMKPPIAHCLDVYVPRWTASSVPRPVPEELEVDQKLARVLVNEFPLHMHGDTGEQWLWFFDRCDFGPSAHLGGGIDFLLLEGEIDFGDESEGAVLQLQNLQVDPEYRRIGIGSRLARYAVALLSRSDRDLVVGEMLSIRPMFEPLFRDPESEHLPAIEREEPGVVRAFMASLGFDCVEATSRVEQEVGLPEDYSDPPGPIFYQKVDFEDRARWLNNR